MALSDYLNGPTHRRQAQDLERQLAGLQERYTQVQALAQTRSLGILVLGSNIPIALLQQLEAGKKLIPEVTKCQRGKWHPEDLIDPLPGEGPE